MCFYNGIEETDAERQILHETAHRAFARCKCA